MVCECDGRDLGVQKRGRIWISALWADFGKGAWVGLGDECFGGWVAGDWGAGELGGEVVWWRLEENGGAAVADLTCEPRVLFKI